MSRRSRTHDRYAAHLRHIEVTDNKSYGNYAPSSPQAAPDAQPVHESSSDTEDTDIDNVMAPKLVGTGTLPELDVKAVYMAYELQRVFDKFENFFEINRLTNSDDDVKLKAGLLRQYTGDANLAAINPIGRDRTKTYEELKAAIEKKFQPVYNKLMLRAQFVRCTMGENQSSRDFLQTLWKAIRHTSCQDADEELQLGAHVLRHEAQQRRATPGIRTAPAKNRGLGSSNHGRHGEQTT